MSDKYGIVLKNIIKSRGIIPKYGTTLLAIWDNEEHFTQWSNLVTNEYVKDIRIVTVPSGLLPNNTIYDKETIWVAGLAFGVKRDYSDLRLMYQMEIQ